VCVCVEGRQGMEDAVAKEKPLWRSDDGCGNKGVYVKGKARVGGGGASTHVSHALFLVAGMALVMDPSGITFWKVMSLVSSHPLAGIQHELHVTEGMPLKP
jgi:hypothetical protein